MKTLRFILILILSFAFNIVVGQSLPVGTAALEDYYRRLQLLGIADSTVSLMIRPIYPTISMERNDTYYPDGNERRYDFLKIGGNTYTSNNRKLTIKLLPITINTQFNSHHPYGWNDGAMIPSKGIQTLLSPGLYMQYGSLSIQLKPELVSAANNKFDSFYANTYPVLIARYYDFYNNIDLPVRFGKNQLSKAYWGQSSIRLNHKALSIGLSSENLWWGPGIRNSLLMSNTAPGFKHLTINTRRPISTKIGSFEGQIIAGKVEGSGYGVLQPEGLFFGDTLLVKKPDDWRYLSGVAITWQPKWIAGLFLGMTRTSQLYSKDLSKFSDYLPLFSQNRTLVADNPINKKDNRNSLFMRWIFSEEKAEIYFEYGKNNNSNTALNRILEPERNRAYIFGLRKMVPFNKLRDENLLISIEATQLQESNTDDALAGQSWYINKYVRHGYTNRGEVVGAGIGPGANSQTIDFSWTKDLKRIGIQFERYVHNNDYYIYAFNDTKDARRHWTDLSIAGSGEWNYKNLIFNAKLMVVKSLNYQWYLYQAPTDKIWVNGRDVYNIQMQAGLTYRF